MSDTKRLDEQEGHSVLAHITDFLPYFYVAMPRGFTSEDLTPFMDWINVSLSLMLFAAQLTSERGCRTKSNRDLCGMQRLLRSVVCGDTAVTTGSRL